MDSIAAFFLRPAANGWANTTPPVKDPLPVFQRPTTGRTTRLGRKVEKPGDATAAGPSGQHEGTQHNLRHTNK
jgi:hypothetical protein